MIQCQNCGQRNAPESQFCRFCGTKFLVGQPIPQRQQQQPPPPRGYDYQYQPPRPYAWKTDEFQTQTGPRAAGNAPQPLAARDAPFMASGYRCPTCMSQFLPRVDRRISTTGWIVFAVLLVVFFPLFWVGLLIKEDVYVCPSCNTRLNN